MKKMLSFHFGRSAILLAVILALGLFLRFRYLTQIEHNVDHAYPIWQAMTTLDEGHFPLAGQGTSVLFANPPLTGYLYIPVIALTRSPLGVYVFVIALNWLAIWMAYRAVRGLLGTTPGLIAAFLMAVNPWVIEYSRTSWVQSLLPFFSCAMAWLLWPVLMGKSQRPGQRLLLALVVATLFSQTYLLAYFIAAPIVILLVYFRKRVPWRAAGIGLLIFFAASAVYGVGLYQQKDNVRERIEVFFGGEGGQSRLNFEAWDGAVRLITGSEYELARGLDAPIQDSQTRHEFSRIAHFTVLGALLIGIARALWIVSASDDTCKRDSALILLIWFLLPILAMSYTRNPVHPFYQILGFPAGFALAGWGITTVLRPDSYRVAAIGLTIAAIPFAVLMAINSARYYQETAAIPGAHDLFALPVGTGMEIGKAINEAEATVAFAEVEGWIINSFAGRLFPVVWDTRAPAFNYLPRDTGVYIDIGDSPPRPFGTVNEETIPLADGKDLIIDTLAPADTVSFSGEPVNIPSQQGLTLISYQVGQVEKTITVTSVWRVDAIGPEVPGLIFAPFIHVLNAADARILIADGEGIAGSGWYVGDVQFHRMTFTLPENEIGPFRLLLGQFDGLHGVNIIFLPRDSDPTLVIELPPVINS